MTKPHRECAWFPDGYTYDQKETFKKCTGMRAAMDNYDVWKNTLFSINTALNPAGSYTSCIMMFVNEFVRHSLRGASRRCMNVVK